MSRRHLSEVEFNAWTRQGAQFGWPKGGSQLLRLHRLEACALALLGEGDQEVQGGVQGGMDDGGGLASGPVDTGPQQNSVGLGADEASPLGSSGQGHDGQVQAARMLRPERQVARKPAQTPQRERVHGCTRKRRARLFIFIIFFRKSQQQTTAATLVSPAMDVGLLC